MKKKILLSLLLFLSFFSFSYFSYNNTFLNTILGDNNVVSKVLVNKVYAQDVANLTDEDIKTIEQNISHIEIIDSIYKKKRKPKISLIIDKEIQKELYGNKIILDFNNKEYFIGTDILVVFILEKEDFYNFLQNGIFSFTILNENEKIKVQYKPFKDLSKTKKLLLDHKLYLKKNGDDFIINVLDQSMKAEDKTGEITITKENYKREEIKKIPGFLGYTSTFQLFISILLPVDLFLLVFIFGFLYKRLRKSNN